MKHLRIAPKSRSNTMVSVCQGEGRRDCEGEGLGTNDKRRRKRKRELARETDRWVRIH